VIDRADGYIRTWLGSAVEGAEVAFAAPVGHRDGAGVNVHLVELYEAPAARGLSRPAPQVGLRYLVTAWAETAEVAHRLLGRALVAAMEQPDVEVLVEPPGFELWFALGVQPQACFSMRLVAR
jgi:hypothetical protein